MRPQPLPPQPDDERSRAGATPAQGQKAPRRIASETLFAGAAEVEIEHQAQLYRLRRTSLGKLILTK